MLKTAEEPMMATTQSRTPIHSHPEIMSGVPVFVGTRVPVRNLIDYLVAGDGIDAFLDDFPGVSRDQAVAALEIAFDMLVAVAHARPAG